MSKVANKTGETNYNNFGSKMIIIEYRTARDIDVYFPEYNWIVKNRQYVDFKKGRIKCPYEKSVYKVGYIGEGKYEVSKNNKHTKCYQTWHGMLRRCYNSKHQEEHHTYVNCKVLEDWHNFQNFGEWDEDNYYEIEGERMELDKDILIKHNKIYSPETCMYMPQTINLLFTKRQNYRGKSVIGTSPVNGKYLVQCHLINLKTGKSKQKTLGYYDTEIEAFEVYKYHKEKNIKQVADYYKDKIPQKLYDAMYNYEVEITD